MPEMHLKQPGFTYSTCRPFSKNKERIQKIKETGHAKHIYRNEYDKACFQYDMPYEDFEDLAKGTLKDKAFNIAKNSKYEGYQGILQRNLAMEESKDTYYSNLPTKLIK